MLSAINLGKCQFKVSFCNLGARSKKGAGTIIPPETQNEAKRFLFFAASS